MTRFRELFLRVRHRVRTDPRVTRAARHLAGSGEFRAWVGADVPLPAVVAIARDALLGVWQAALEFHVDAGDDDALLEEFELVDLDAWGVPGIGVAMAAPGVGLAAQTEAGVILPGYCRHNGRRADERERDLERKRRERQAERERRELARQAAPESGQVQPAESAPAAPHVGSVPAPSELVRTCPGTSARTHVEGEGEGEEERERDARPRAGGSAPPARAGSPRSRSRSQPRAPDVGLDELLEVFEARPALRGLPGLREVLPPWAAKLRARGRLWPTRADLEDAADELVGSPGLARAAVERSTAEGWRSPRFALDALRREGATSAPGALPPSVQRLVEEERARREAVLA